MAFDDGLGIPQPKNGPCGVLAAMQASVIAHCHKTNTTFDLEYKPSPEVIAASIANMLRQAATATYPSTVPGTGEGEADEGQAVSVEGQGEGEGMGEGEGEGGEGVAKGDEPVGSTQPPLPTPPTTTTTEADATVTIARWADPEKVRLG